MTFVVIAIPFFIVKIYDVGNFLYVSNVYVRVKDEKTGNISKVVLEDYIAGVLAGEMPISFEVEALKAQAVAARSYVLKQMGYNKNRDYDVVNTVTNQVYLTDEYLRSVWQNDYNVKMEKLKKAVSETSTTPVATATPGVAAQPSVAAGVQLPPGVQVVINNAPTVTPYTPPPPIVYKKRIVFVLLGIFLGCFGFHNFYAGFAGRGVSQLLLSLLLLATPLMYFPVYIWVIFEILFVTEDARSVRMV